VGGRTVRMETLKRVFEALGFANVHTFIASGNVVFETRAADEERLTRTIERALREALGYEVGAFLRSDAELRRIADHRPFPRVTRDASVNDYVLFLASPPPAAVKRQVAALAGADHEFEIRGRDLYWLRHRIDGVPFSAVPLEKALGVPFTIRGAKTVAKMADKFCKRRHLHDHGQA
jgi:uncharacterized protein (DUF1697 family)